MTDPRTSYPVRVDAALDPSLSRGLWLVKWLLLIPHYVVLFFLSVALVVVTVIAFFAILFTGRYPGRCSTSTSESCGGPGACTTTATATAPWAPTVVRRSRLPTCPTIRRTWTWPTPNGCPGASSS
ncbi:DUF4389 domain-containing protein [Geodermatophilus amargosae]|uniref:DUF4389 domain-containing protein n=1 Tax=Geodermatophilus amargosae TaxID=1296565 RepID=UPI003CCBA310